MPKTAAEIVNGIARSIRTQKQYAAKLRSGDMSEDDVQQLALARLARQVAPAQGPAPSQGLTEFNMYTVIEGQPLLADTDDGLSAWAHVLDDADQDALGGDGHPDRFYRVTSQSDSQGKLAALLIDLRYDGMASPPRSRGGGHRLLGRPPSKGEENRPVSGRR